MVKARRNLFSTVNNIYLKEKTHLCDGSSLLAESGLSFPLSRTTSGEAPTDALNEYYVPFDRPRSKKVTTFVISDVPSRLFIDYHLRFVDNLDSKLILNITLGYHSTNVPKIKRVNHDPHT